MNSPFLSCRPASVGIVFRVSIALWLCALLCTSCGKQATADDAGDRKAPDESAPVVAVKVAPVEQSTITQQNTAYGTVTAQLAEVRAVSVVFESQVSRIVVTPGQQVAADEVLLTVEPSAATRMQLQDAQNAFEAAEKDLKQTQERYAAKLATNQELFASQANHRSAKSKLENLQQAGAAGPRTLRAEVAGVVSKIDVQVGQIVPGGTPLVELAAANRIEVMLGVEPQDAPALQVGQPIRIASLQSESNVLIGHVRLVTRRIDPTTRLINVYVSIPQDAPATLDAPVRAEITTSSQGLIVPRDAVLPADDQYVLFTIENKKAAKHVVSIGLENDKEVQIIGGGVKAGDQAVVVGNYELADGMAVHVDSGEAASAPATESSSKPATTEAAP